MYWHPQGLWMRVVPELGLFESKAERKRAFLFAKTSARPRGVLRTLAFVYVAVGMFVMLCDLTRSLQYSLGGLAVVLFLFFGVGPFAASWFLRKEIRTHLRQQLIRSGVPICVKRGYQLRGRTEPRCPECAEPFDAQPPAIAAHELEKSAGPADECG